jgi:hypothetical protein
MVVRTEKSVGILRERACRWHQWCSFAPGRRFRLSRFKGIYIIRNLTRLRNSIKNDNVSNWLEPED